MGQGLNSIATHEDLSRTHAVKRASDRAFGLVFCGAFLIIGLLPLLHHDHTRWWAVVLAGSFGLTGLLMPNLLNPLNRGWALLGILLGRITGGIGVAAVFFLVFAPMAIILRAFSAHLLSLDFDQTAKSYWVKRTMSDAQERSLRNQF